MRALARCFLLVALLSDSHIATKAHEKSHESLISYSRVFCGSNGVCNVGGLIVKPFNSQGPTRSAFVSGRSIPWLFDCSGYSGKRIRRTNSNIWETIGPGELYEDVYDFMCSISQ